MSSTFYDLPQIAVTATNPSVGTNGATAPTSSTEVAGINPGGNLQPLQTDASGNLLVNIAANTDTPIPVKDSADGTTGSAVPTIAIQVGGTDGTNLRAVSTDTTGKVQIASIANALPAGTNLLGKVGIDQTTPGTTNGVQVNAALPAGTNLIGKTGIDQTTPGTTNAVSLAQVGATTVATGNGVSGAGVQRVNIASDNTAFPVTVTATDITASGSITTQNLNPSSGVATAGSFVAITLNGQSVLSIQVTGTYTGALTPQATVDGSNWIAISSLMNANTGAFTATITSASVGIWQAGVTAFKQFRISANAAVTGTAVVSIQGSIAAGQTSIDVPLPTGANTIGNVGVVAGSALIGKVGIDQTTVGTTNAVSLAQIGANTISTGIGASGTGTQRVIEASSATSTLTNVASSASSVVLLASNTNRLNATFFNDSTAILYLKLGTTASNTSYTVQLQAGGYYELPLGRIYTGEIDGIWASANGNCRVTELT